MMKLAMSGVWAGRKGLRICLSSDTCYGNEEEEDDNDNNNNDDNNNDDDDDDDDDGFGYIALTCASSIAASKWISSNAVMRAKG